MPGRALHFCSGSFLSVYKEFGLLSLLTSSLSVVRWIGQL